MNLRDNKNYLFKNYFLFYIKNDLSWQENFFFDCYILRKKMIS